MPPAGRTGTIAVDLSHYIFQKNGAVRHAKNMSIDGCRCELPPNSYFAPRHLPGHFFIKTQPNPDTQKFSPSAQAPTACGQGSAFALSPFGDRPFCPFPRCARLVPPRHSALRVPCPPEGTPRSGHPPPLAPPNSRPPASRRPCPARVAARASCPLRCVHSRPAARRANPRPQNPAGNVHPHPDRHLPSSWPG